MARRVKAVVRLQILAGKATPAPPVGPALGQYGINLPAFCKEYNEKTASMTGMTVPVEVTIFDDRSYSFITRTPPAVDLIKQELNLDKGSGNPNTQKVGTLSRATLHKIAEMKLKDLNALDVAAAEKMIEGTARSMGVTIEA
ncbi:MAG: 50S ribosomal protein L11 [Chloroflexi bacterium]|nr:50S ribosomal protein L11 [Chloroflexota bacterium]MCL4545727.1 50S ribosomal protein L11 [Chloroflexota bacterium]